MNNLIRFGPGVVKLITLVLFQSVFLASVQSSALTPAKDSVTKASARRFPNRDSTREYKHKTVVVTATRNNVLQDESPVRAEVLSQQQIQSTGAADLSSALQQIPGVAISSGLHNGVQMNGLSADYTQILVDGVPLIGRVAGIIDLSRIATANVERIEVVKGPMSSLYGNEALAGVINLITRKPDDGWTGRVRSQYMFREGVQSVAGLSYSGDSFLWNLSLDTKFSPEFSLRQDSLERPYAAFTDYTIQFRAKYYFTSSLNATINSRYFKSHSSGKFFQSFFGQVAPNNGAVNQYDAGLSAMLDWTISSSHLNAMFYYTAFEQNYVFDVAQGEAGTDDNFHRSLYRVQAKYDGMWNEYHRGTLGIEYSYDATSGTRYASAPFYRTGVVYAQWEGDPNTWLRYALSARLDANNQFGNNISPKLSLLFRNVEGFDFRLSVGSGFKAPDFRQLYVSFQNNLNGAGYLLVGSKLLGRDLQAERSVAYEASLLWRPAGSVFGDSLLQFQTEVRAFRNDLTNLIEYYLDHSQGTTAVYSYRNLSRVFTQGMEVSARANYMLERDEYISLSSAVQILDARDQAVVDAIDSKSAGTIDSKTGSFIPLTNSSYGGLWYRSKIIWSVRLEYKHSSGLMISSQNEYTGRFGDQALDRNGSVLANSSTAVADRDDEYASGYWNLKVNLSMQWGFDSVQNLFSSLQLNCGVRNILNHLDLRSIPTLYGRQWYGSVELGI